MNRRDFIKRAAAAAVTFPIVGAAELHLLRTYGAPKKAAKFAKLSPGDTYRALQWAQKQQSAIWNADLYSVAAFAK